MICFIDASVIVAIIGREDDWEVFADQLDDYAERLWSATSYWESVMALSQRLKSSIESAEEIVRDFASVHGLQLVPIDFPEAKLAMEAARRYGKGSGHPARLNMGDCFAYACAKAHNARLLYKGDDFARTDLA